MCLPTSLRQVNSPDVADRKAPTPAPDKDGVEFRSDTIMSFAKVMDSAADVVSMLQTATPRFEGSNLAPVAGVPMIGLMFVSRLNAIADAWADCAAILREVLKEDGHKLMRVAQNYRAANEQTVAAIEKTDPWKTTT
ncbi:hypothetical protein ACFWYW_44375 [Nonomuraea sp. NPDC059023]|uniref:hypothetical protein n=1 Tax=unclassified Nonomuraea TaxID=2593643 RepID=UPI0036BD848B